MSLMSLILDPQYRYSKIAYCVLPKNNHHKTTTKNQKPTTKHQTQPPWFEPRTLQRVPASDAPAARSATADPTAGATKPFAGAKPQAC
mmetsp:Transcript_16959/g.46568  ORF Transcript_16959/g.46568 Transcript_16959/m.46568 type:complete len:88 (-) Transcript_16959:3196-3459(-)